MRFRKSVKICKGVKINFSKSGASVTAGLPGFSFTTGHNGSYMNYGLPGTGLYDRKKISGDSNGNSNHSQTRSSYQTQQQVISTVFNLHMEDNGSISFTYDDGRPVTDESLIRKVKATSQFKSERDRMQREHIASIAEKVADFNDSVSSIINIHKLSAKVDSKEMFLKELNELQPIKYTKIPFEIMAPNIEDIRQQLNLEAQQNVKSAAFWTVKSKREEYVNTNLNVRYAWLLSEWEKQKAEFENQQIEIEEVKNAEFEQQYTDKKSALEAAIAGDECYINISTEEWLANIELPLDFDIQFEYNPDTKILYLDLDLPEIEDMPSEKATQLANGNMKIINKTQKEIKEDYSNCVFSLAIFFASHLYNISPEIVEIIISGFTQRRDSKGEICDDYIYSIKFTRNQFETSVLENVKPYDFCMLFENRCLLTQTMLFKKIEPFTP